MTNSRMTNDPFIIANSSFVIRTFVICFTGGYRIRTCEGISHQIYSLTHLTALVTPRDFGRISLGRNVPELGQHLDRERPNNLEGILRPVATGARWSDLVAGRMGTRPADRAHSIPAAPWASPLGDVTTS